MDNLDPLYLAFLYFRINKIEDCHLECTRVLEKNPLDQVFSLIIKFNCKTYYKIKIILL